MSFDISQLRSTIPAESGEYDVVVAGGGPAGLGAAWSAAKMGAKVLLLESRSFFGGVAGVAMWMPMNRMLKNGNSRGAVHEAFVSKLDAMGKEEAYSYGIENNYAVDGIGIHPDYGRLAAFELLEDAGAHYLLYSQAIDVLLEGNQVRGVVAMCKDGRKEFRAKTVIDCTGDADLAFAAGAPCVKGREEDGMMMPMSLIFALYNCDTAKALDLANNRRDELRSVEEAAQKEGYDTARWHFFDTTSLPGVISVNNGGSYTASAEGWNLDGTKSSDLTIAERVNIKVAHEFVRIAREKKIPGLENCVLARTGAAVGVRETRRIIGEYVQTEEDVREGTFFPDTISVRPVKNIDSQGMVKKEAAAPENFVPYRCLLPQKVENLLVAGKCSAFTQVALCAGRAMGNMMDLGQAAGVAAARSVAAGTPPRKVEVTSVQNALRDLGVDLPTAVPS